MYAASMGPSEQNQSRVRALSRIQARIQESAVSATERDGEEIGAHTGNGRLSQTLNSAHRRAKGAYITPIFSRSALTIRLPLPLVPLRQLHPVLCFDDDVPTHRQEFARIPYAGTSAQILRVPRWTWWNAYRCEARPAT